MSRTIITMADFDDFVLSLIAEGAYVTSGKDCCFGNAMEEMKKQARDGQSFVLLDGNAIADSFGENVAFPELVYLDGLPMRIIDVEDGIAFQPLRQDEATAMECALQMERETAMMREPLPLRYGINGPKGKLPQQRAFGLKLVDIARSLGIRIELEDARNGSAIIHPESLSVAA